MGCSALRGWHLYSGPWWMIQWQVDGWASLGAHVDLRRRHTARGEPYGPYVDVHLLFVILSLGINPKYSGELDSSVGVSRGGTRASDC